jgi:hypothetical protein
MLFPMKSSGLAEAHVKNRQTANPKGISTFGFTVLIALCNQNRQENNLLRHKSSIAEAGSLGLF